MAVRKREMGEGGGKEHILVDGTKRATRLRVKWKGLSAASKSLQLSQESGGDGGMIGGDQGNMGNTRKPQGLGRLREEGTTQHGPDPQVSGLSDQRCSTREASRPWQANGPWQEAIACTSTTM